MSDNIIHYEFNPTPMPVTSQGKYLFSECKSFCFKLLNDKTVALIKGPLRESHTWNNPSEIPSHIQIENIILPVTQIGSEVFLYNVNERISFDFHTENLYIPNTVTQIDKNAFNKCSGLQHAIIASNITKINNGVFKDCDNLESIQLPEGITEIGEYAFLNCKKLTQINIPSSVTKIGKSAFENCTSLKHIQISNISIISANAFFKCTSLEHIDLPESLIQIENNAFMECSSLSQIVIPASVSTIGEGAFACTNIKITNKSDKFIVENDILYSADKHDMLYTPTSITGTFQIPNNVTHIHKDVFRSCTNLKQVIIPESVKTIDDGVFANTAIDIINHAQNYLYIDGVFYLTKEKRFSHKIKPIKILHVSIYTINEFRIPKTISQIGYSAFEGCALLKSIFIPLSVDYIYRWAFRNCKSLVNVHIKGKPEIHPNSFEGCDNYNKASTY